MPFDLRKAAAERLLLVAHRGSAGADIPCNTLAAYKNALYQGADMIEIDVEMTSDGKLIVFHPGMEPAQLGRPERLCTLPWNEVKELRYINTDDVPTPFGICTLDEVLEECKGKCFINVDKFWAHPREISDAIRRHGMTDQVLVKTGPQEDALAIVEAYCADMPYMGIIRRPEDMAIIEKRNVKLTGYEVLFQTDDSPLVTEAFIEEQHRKNLLLWCNSIVYNYRDVIAAGHTDDAAILGDRDGSWGWIADRGFDLLQTDYVLQTNLYFSQTGRRPGTGVLR